MAEGRRDGKGKGEDYLFSLKMHDLQAFKQSKTNKQDKRSDKITDPAYLIAEKDIEGDKNKESQAVEQSEL